MPYFSLTYLAIASLSSLKPSGDMYLVYPLSRASLIASITSFGGEKSGCPIPKLITSTPLLLTSSARSRYTKAPSGSSCSARGENTWVGFSDSIHHLYSSIIATALTGLADPLTIFNGKA